MNRVVCILLLVLGNSLLSFGHNFNISFTQLTSIENGLSQSTVNTLVRDSKGDFWIGTHQGLNRYTLHGLYSYFASRNDSTSLPDNYVFDIIEDQDNQIWVSTKSGVVTYDRCNDNFEFRLKGLVLTMLSTDDGMIFGGENCIMHLNSENRMDTVYLERRLNGENASYYRIRDMVMWGESGKVLLGTLKHGVYVYDIATRKVSRFSQPAKNPLLSIVSASDGCVYVSYFGEGFYCYDENGVPIAHYNMCNSELNDNYVHDILEYKGFLFLATDEGGINIFNMKQKKFYHVPHNFNSYFSSSMPSVTTLYRDSYDNFWAGSVRKGVFLINDNYIKTFGAVEPGNTNGTSENTVTSLYEEDDRLWIGTDGGGINIYNPKNNKFHHFESTFGRKILSITPYSENELLVSAFTKGFYLMDKKTGRYSPFKLMDQDGNNILSTLGYLPKAYKVSATQIWFVGVYVYSYNLITKKTEIINIPGQEGYTTMDLAYQNEDFVLLKSDNKAFKVDISSHEALKLFEVSSKENITSMSYDGQRIVWVGTSTGLGCLDIRDQVYRPLSSNHFSYVSYLHFDKNKRLWICAHNMLLSYSVKRKKFIQWNQYDGFMPNEILPNFHRHVSDEYIFMGGAQGLVKIDMDIPDPVECESEVMLDEFLFNGKPYDGPVHKGKVQVPWDYNSLTVRVIIKNKDIFQRNHFQFKVMGENVQTINTDRPELSLSALPPGKYSVNVSCYTKNGDNIEPVNLVEIEILPPWYATIWFKLFLGLLFLTLGFGVEYAIIRRQQKSFKGSVNYFLRALLKKMDDTEGNVENEETIEATTVLSSEDEVFIMKLNKIIEENISNENFGVNMLAETMGISRATLYNKVKNIAGIGVNDYINKARIERSVYLLTHTNMSISEISYEVGFNYPRYFSTSFKHVKGITPTRFKEENKKKSAKKENEV